MCCKLPKSIRVSFECTCPFSAAVWNIAIAHVFQSRSMWCTRNNCSVNLSHWARRVYCPRKAIFHSFLWALSYVVCEEGSNLLHQTTFGTAAGWAHYLSQQRTELLASAYFVDASSLLHLRRTSTHRIHGPHNRSFLQPIIHCRGLNFSALKFCTEVLV